MVEFNKCLDRDSIARSGKGENIKLDIEKLGDLYQLVTGNKHYVTRMCDIFK